MARSKKAAPGWVEKFRRLTEGMNQDRLARRAGITNISQRLAAGNIPNAYAAVRLARELNVPADWLFDDEQSIEDAPAALIPLAPSDPQFRALVLGIVARALDRAAGDVAATAPRASAASDRPARR